MNSSTLAWNPLEAFVFTTANEDYKYVLFYLFLLIFIVIFVFSLYSFDIRYLQRPFNVHKDHVAAVIDVDYSPTGKEFVSGSFDKTIRIFSTDKGHSRLVYNLKFISLFLTFNSQRNLSYKAYATYQLCSMDIR
jgi:WD repeat and SOF domain-containing protein 1